VDPLLKEFWQNQAALRKKKEFFDFTIFKGESANFLNWLKCKSRRGVIDA